MKEWHRTVLLICLLAIAVAFVVWQKTQYQTNFIDTL